MLATVTPIRSPTGRHKGDYQTLHLLMRLTNLPHS